MFTKKMQGQKWTKWLSLFVVLTMLTCFVGFTGGDQAYAATTSMSVKLDGIEEGNLSSSNILNNLNCVKNNYSALNSVNTVKFYTAKGLSLVDIAAACGIDALTNDLADVTSIQIKAADGASVTFSKTDLLGTRYYYPNLANNDDSGKVQVPALIAAEDASGIDQTTLYTSSCLRLYMGQSSLTDQNNGSFMKDVSEINFITQ